MRDVTDQLQTRELDELIRTDYDTAIQKISESYGFNDTYPIQPTERLPKEYAGLPKEYAGLPNGHNGTHQFLTTISAVRSKPVSSRPRISGLWQDTTSLDFSRISLR